MYFFTDGDYITGGVRTILLFRLEETAEITQDFYSQDAYCQGDVALEVEGTGLFPIRDKERP
jgi:hypothetical protein